MSAEQQGPEGQDVRVGVFLRLRPTQELSSRVSVDLERRWMEFNVPKHEQG
jgi:hypothetical protein